MTAHDVTRALERRHKRDKFFAQVKNGPSYGAGQLAVMDAVAVKPSWANPCITGYEIKVSKSDFKGDEKWPQYMALCHRFYWACPKGLIAPDEIDPRVGLVWVSDAGVARTRVKAPFRAVELDAWLLYYLVLYRADEYRPAESREQAIRRWLDGKANNYDLAHALNTRMVKELTTAVRERDAIRDEYAKVKEVMDKHKIRDAWTLDYKLQDRVDPRHERVIRSALRSAERNADELREVLNEVAPEADND